MQLRNKFFIIMRAFNRWMQYPRNKIIPMVTAKEMEILSELKQSGSSNCKEVLPLLHLITREVYRLS